MGEGGVIEILAKITWPSEPRTNSAKAFFFRELWFSNIQILTSNFLRFHLLLVHYETSTSSSTFVFLPVQVEMIQLIASNLLRHAEGM